MVVYIYIYYITNNVRKMASFITENELELGDKSLELVFNGGMCQRG